MLLKKMWRLVALLVLAAAWIVPESAADAATSGLVAVRGPSSVQVGSEFQVQIIVENVQGPAGLFGAQFQLNFEREYLQAIDSGVRVGTALEPALAPVQKVDNSGGYMLFAATRQNSAPELNGDVTIATARFRAVKQTTKGRPTQLGLKGVVLADRESHTIATAGSKGLELEINAAPPDPSVQAKVTLQGRTQHDGAVVELYNTSTLKTYSDLTDADGDAVVLGVPQAAAGRYVAKADAPGYLPAECSPVPIAISPPLVVLKEIKLLAGDVNDDNRVDALDLAAIGLAFGDKSKEPRADLNNDGLVNVLDLVLLGVNFGLGSSGPLPSWVCG
jgi:hypothetical protein